MALNREEVDFKNSVFLEGVREQLKKSSIYVDINKIIDAYEKERELEQDELFCVPSSSSNEDKKFSVSKFAEARKLFESGKIKAEIVELERKIKTHRYILQKNREKDRENLEYLKDKHTKIKNCAWLVDTKREWLSIIDNSYPVKDPKNPYVHSLGYFIDVYKDLATNMEKTCFRHKNDDSFVEKLNNMLEQDMMESAEPGEEQGRSDYQFALKSRKDFIEALDKNRERYFQDEMENYENLEWL